jgi:hypothetical protein
MLSAAPVCTAERTVGGACQLCLVFPLFQHQDSGERILCYADKFLAFPVFYFPICTTTKRIFLGWVKEVRTMKS